MSNPPTNPDVSEFSDDPFFQELMRSGRSRLERENQSLASRSRQLEDETRGMAFDHYSTFISAADCCHEIAGQFRRNQEQVSALTDDLPKVASTCLDFHGKALKLSEERKKTSLVLANHTKLLEVLELPQLMETCVRNGHTEEALAIIQVANKIGKPLGGVPLIDGLVKSIHVSAVWMLNQLLAKLKTQIQLPECLKIVGLIRRMGAFNEAELRIKFLQARKVHLDNILKALPNTDQLSLLSKMVEQTRIGIFDTITQYRALFSDDETRFTGTRSSISSYRMIFSSWIYQRLHKFQEHLVEGLNQLNDIQGLEALVDQVMYFGQSLGRVGYDMRILAIPKLNEFAVRCLQNILDQGRINLKEVLANSQLVYDFSIYDKIEHGPKAEGEFQVTYYPVAIVYNTIVQCLNQFRYRMSVTTAVKMKTSMKSFLSEALDIIKDFEAINAKQGPLLQEEMTEKTIPHLNDLIDELGNDFARG